MRAWISVVFIGLVPAFSGCGDDPPPRIEPTYENVASVIARSCTFSGVCHGDPAGSADLFYTEGSTDITTVLNGVSSCEYNLMPRVDPGNPDNSWIMIKLDGMYDETGAIQFTPDPGWMSTSTNPDCATFGAAMPLSVGAPTPLPMNEIVMFREWIMLGALGPSGG